MRTFIGIDFPKSLKEQIVEVQSFLKSISKKGRWKYIDNFHLTLKFLGDIEYEKVEKIRQALEKNLKDFSRFSLKISSCGYFKGHGNLRVVYLKPDGNLEKLNNLFRLLRMQWHMLDLKEKKERTHPI